MFTSTGVVPMNMGMPSQRDLILLKRYSLLVTFICYLPHIFTEPIWLFIIFLGAVSYRIFADYYSYPPLTRWIRFVLVFGFLILLSTSIYSGQFLIRFLLVFISLKCLELHTVRDLKVLILCNFFLIFSALIVIQEIEMVVYLLIAILANLFMMLKMTAPKANLKLVLGRSSKQLMLVIPISLMLFYFFPRIDPLWRIPSPAKSTTGFDEKMSFGSIAEVFNDDSAVMQITFFKKAILNGYWKGVFLNYYDGESWRPGRYSYADFVSLPFIQANEPPDYEIILEPNQTKWLFFEGYPTASKPHLLFAKEHGLIRYNKEPVTRRFGYSLVVDAPAYHPLTTNESNDALQLPIQINPRLRNWSKQEFALRNNNVDSFVQFLRSYIRQQPFWYTLSPPVLAGDRNQMDRFWFETKRGFCEHYAGTVTFILRAAGIPARVVVGYQGGQWNPIANTIFIQQNNAHAWVEYWKEGAGWLRLDPTLFIAPQRIEQTIRNRQLDLLSQQSYLSISEVSFGRRIQFFSQSIRFYYERWFLFYNPTTQYNLLQNIGLGHWNKEQLLQASVGMLILFFLLIGIGYRWRQRRALDKLLLEYQLLQKEFRRFQIVTAPSITLKQQCTALMMKVPHLKILLVNFLDHYEQLRLRQLKNNKSETVQLFRKLRWVLRKNKRTTL